jgi:hypothetical protein
MFGERAGRNNSTGTSLVRKSEDKADREPADGNVAINKRYALNAHS